MAATEMQPTHIRVVAVAARRLLGKTAAYLRHSKRAMEAQVRHRQFRAVPLLMQAVAAALETALEAALLERVAQAAAVTGLRRR